MRLIILEDYLLVSWALRLLCTNLGHVVVGLATNPDAAMKLAHDDNIAIDLALVDIRLENNTSGIDAARMLGDLDIPSVYITAYRGDSEWVPGVIGTLCKPYSQGEIELTLNACERIITGKDPGPVPNQFILYEEKISGTK